MNSLNSFCECNKKIIMCGHCAVHDREWQTEIDANSIHDLLKRIEALENKLKEEKL